MKKFVLVTLAVLLTISGFAQKTADIGIWGGTSTYFGDLREVPPFQTFNPNLGAFFRYNFNPRVSIRAMFITGSFKASGRFEEYPWSFEKNVQDLSVQAEINFLKYRLGDKKTPFSPYILGGIGVMYFPYKLDPALLFTINPDHNKGVAEIDESVMTMTVPFGFGIKTNIGEKIGVGIEYLMRKQFVDKLDNLDDPLAYIDDKGVVHLFTDKMHNNDWSGYLGIHLTFKIYMGKEACPAYDSIYR